jgi:hypothetical protein
MIDVRSLVVFMAVLVMLAMPATAATISVTRELPDTVTLGAEFEVSVTQSGFYVTGFVTEQLPEGFNYRGVSSGGKLFEYNEATNKLTIAFNSGETTLRYKLKAGTAEQIKKAVFSGTWTTVDSKMNILSGSIGGETTLAPTPTPTPTITPTPPPTPPPRVDKLSLCDNEGYAGDLIEIPITLASTSESTRIGHWRTYYKAVEGDDEKMDITSWIKIIPTEYTLEPREVERFTVRITIPEDAKPGLYGATSEYAGMDGHSGERRTYIIFEDADSAAVLGGGSAVYSGLLIPVSVKIIDKPTPPTTPPATPEVIPPNETIISKIKPLGLIYYADVDKATRELVIDITLENIGEEEIKDVYVQMESPSALRRVSFSGAIEKPEGLYIGTLNVHDSHTVTQRYKLTGDVEGDLRIPVTVKASGSGLETILVLIIVISEALLKLLSYGIIPGFEAIIAVIALLAVGIIWRFRTLTPHHLGNMFNPSLSSRSITFFGTSVIMPCPPTSKW